MSSIENFHNLGADQIIQISLVLYSAYILPKYQDKVLFYIDNNINLNQFNKLYDPDMTEKSIQNTNVVA